MCFQNEQDTGWEEEVSKVAQDRNMYRCTRLANAPRLQAILNVKR